MPVPLIVPHVLRYRQARGLTLLESMIVMAVLATLLSGVFAFLVSARDHFESVTIESDLRDRTRIVMEFICNELRQASADTIEINDSATTLGGSKISFQKATGYSGGALQLGPVATFTWVLAPNESVLGADEDTDGIMDEGYVRYNDGTGDSDIADNCGQFLEGEVGDSVDNNGNDIVDENGLYFQRKTDATNAIVPEVIVRITLIKRDRYRRVIYETSAEAAVTFRNP
jgi:prepilin-type N-terminal cleavage/methylation domain-containing protein